MCRCLLCLQCAWRSAGLLPSVLPSMSSGHPLSTIFLMRCNKFLISSPSPRRQFSTFIQCMNLFRAAEILVMNCSNVAAQMVAFSISSSEHSVAGLRSREEKSAFSRNILLAKSSRSASVSPNVKLIFLSLVGQKIQRLDRDRYQRNCLGPKSGYAR